MRRHRLLPRVLTLLVAAGIAGLVTSVAACSASNDSTNGFGGSGAGHQTSGQNSGGSGAGTSSLGQGGGVSTLAGGQGGSSSSGFGGGCASTSTKADKLPLDMFIMLDQSGSMSESVPNGTKWSAVTNAIKSFVQLPQDPASPFSVGLQYFGLPPGGGSCPQTCLTDADCGMCGPCFGAQPPNFPGFCLGGGGGDSCNAADYAKAEVEIAPLPGVAPAIINSLNAHSPSTGTPISAALQGVIQHSKDWQIAHPDHVVVAMFTTDGDPSGCDEDQNHINNIAAAGSNGVPKILTFVIGVGQSLVALNGVAAAGGTGQAYLVDTNANANQQFLDALVAIQGKALGCEYLVPKPAMGQLNFDEVNVSYTPDPTNAPNTKEIWPKVNGAGDCPMSGDAWYYDNNAAPTKIILCKGTCDKIKNNSSGQVDVVLGCATIVP